MVEELDAPMNAIVLPHWVVTALAVVPRGAYPSYAHGYYARDNAFYQRWDHIARERATFTDWIEQHVMSTRDHGEFMRQIEHGHGQPARQPSALSPQPSLQP
jgi:glutaconate CoA-transferase subunit A